jgi:superfamily II DNA/RNA helicase
MTENETIVFDGKSYVIPARVIELAGKYDDFDVRAAREIAEEIEQSEADTRCLLNGLFIFVFFRTKIACAELSWLSNKVGGNAVRHVCIAAAKFRKEQRQQVLA